MVELLMRDYDVFAKNSGDRTAQITAFVNGQPSEIIVLPGCEVQVVHLIITQQPLPNGKKQKMCYSCQTDLAPDFAGDTCPNPDCGEPL